MSPESERRMRMEPYRIKVVEPLPAISRSERERALAAADFNLFRLRSTEVIIDLFTDSGTSAMSTEQLAALMRGDESYAGSSSFFRFEQVVGELTGYKIVLPCHQGRAAERILFSCLLQGGDLTLSNGHFDTTRANIELCGAEARDLPSPASADLAAAAPFKGDIDLEALTATLAGPEGDRVRAVVLTITNNAGGGQPASMANAQAAAALCRSHGVPFLLDAARFAENAYLVGRREAAWAGRAPREIAEAMFALADGAWISLKKDGIANIGGVLALNDEALADRCRDLLIATEGFPTYGGLAGRDLEALAQGLLEVTDEEYLASRESAAAYLAALAEDAGVPTVRPPGLHAVYLDAARLLPHLPWSAFPGQALACELYLEAGIRSVEIGTLILGHPGSDGEPDTPAAHELLRLALPRRVYTQSHLEYVGEALRAVAARAVAIPGYRIVQAPRALRHFSARLEPVRVDAVEPSSALPA